MNITKCLATLQKDSEQACKVALKVPKANVQYVILTDVSFYAASYVLLIEDYATDQSGNNTRLTFLFPSDIKIFTPTYPKLSIYSKEFLAVHFAFDTFAHILWGTTKTVLVLTYEKRITKFFQATTIPSSLWTCVDHVLNFNFC